MGVTIALASDSRKIQYSYTETVKLLPAHYLALMEYRKDELKDITLQLFNWLNTQVGFHLDTATANVLRFIIARTYGYYKEAELISIRQLQQGVWDIETNRPICCPVIKDVRTARKAFIILERLGYISRHRVTINNVDALPLVRVHAERILKDEHTKEDEIMLRKRRKDKEFDLQEVEEKGETALNPSVLRGVQKCTTQGVQRCPPEYINKEHIKELNGCSVPRNVIRITRTRKHIDEINCKFDTAKEAIAKAVARVTEKRENKVRAAARRAGFITLTDFNATWQSVMIAAYGSCTMSGLTHIEYGMLKRISKTHTLNCSWREFLEWVVANWRRINKESKEYADYRKRKGGDWSLKEEDRIFLGSDAPDTYAFVKSYGKLVKRFAQMRLSGTKAATEDTAEVVQLRKEADEAKRQADINRRLLDRALAAKVPDTAPTPKAKRPVKIVNPATDTFFDEVEMDLPVWR